MSGINVNETGIKAYNTVVHHFGTVRQASAYLGVSIHAIYNWKLYGKMPDIENMVLIADEVGCKVDDLIVRN